MSGVVSWQHSPVNPVQLRAATPAINLTCFQSSRGPTGKIIQARPLIPPAVPRVARPKALRFEF